MATSGIPPGTGSGRDQVLQFTITVAFERRRIRSRFVALLAPYCCEYASVARLVGAAHRRSRCDTVFMNWSTKETGRLRDRPGGDRMALARSFLSAFGRPGKEQQELILGSDWLEDLASQGWLGKADPRTLREGLPRDPGEWESFALSTFDVGFPAPEVPLFETHYLRDGSAPGILHENILYYKTFGCELAEGASDNPDHLRNQLGFLVILCWLESGAEASPETVRSAQAAREEFVGRHLLSWLPEAAKVAERKAHPLWGGLLRALCAWLSEEFRPEASGPVAASFARIGPPED